MKPRGKLLIAVLVSISVVFISILNSEEEEKNNNKYFGMEIKGDSPELFHPEEFGTVDKYLFSISFSPDGLECMVTVTDDMKELSIKKASFKNNRWTDLAFTDIFGSHKSFEPIYTPDGKEIIFGTIRPLPGEDKSLFRQWNLIKVNNEWEISGPLPEPFLLKDVMYCTRALNGNSYFTSIGGLYFSQFSNGIYEEPVKLNDTINWFKYPEMPCISPDESYLIYKAYNSEGNTDLYVSFREAEGLWRKPQPLDEKINSKMDEYCPFITGDGKYLFFSRKSDESARIFWVSTDQIKSLK